MLVDLASDSSLVDWVMKCEKPISWWLMNAHREVHYLSAFPAFLPLSKMFGWMSWESLTLIHIVVQGGHTHYQSNVSTRLGNMDWFFFFFFSCIHSE